MLSKKLRQLVAKRNRRPARHARNRLIGIEGLENRIVMTVNALSAIVGTGDVAGPVQAVTTVSAPEVTARIVNGQTTSEFKSVGIVNAGCSGTLISPSHVLTAAHCVEGVGDTRGTFDVNGQTYVTLGITSHASYDPNSFDGGYDIAIMELAAAINDIQPSEILRVAPQVGQTLKIVGYGEGGTSTGGSSFDFGTLRVGETRLDQVDNLQIAWNFDSHDEANTAPGDSGGPAYVELDGELYIAGITSGGDGDAHQLGDHSFDTRVDVFATWIDSVVGSPTPDPNPNPNPDPDPTPTPDPIPEPAPGPDGEFVNVELDGDVFVDEIGTDAEVIQIGQDGFGFIDGFVNHVGDMDVFQFEVASADLVYVDLFNWNGDLDTQLQIFDQDGAIVSDNNDSYGSTDSSLTLDLEVGTYYVIASANDSSTGEYGLDISVSAENFGEFDDELIDGDDSNDGDVDFDDEFPDDVAGDDVVAEDDFPGGGFEDTEFEGDSFDGGQCSDHGGEDDSFFDDQIDDQWDDDGIDDEFDDDPLDVNDDGRYSPMDVLQIINHLNASVGQRTTDATESQRFDVSGDGAVTPLDALLVINRLNSPQIAETAIFTATNDHRVATRQEPAGTADDEQSVASADVVRHHVNPDRPATCDDRFDEPWFGANDPFAEDDNWLL